MGEAAFLHAPLPQSAAIVFLSLLLLRLFRMFVHILSGFGVVGVITPMFGHEWDSVTVAVAMISFLAGALTSKYLSEENPPFFFFLVFLGIGMTVLNWNTMLSLLNFGFGRLAGSFVGMLPF
jgi:hypothetical protein